MNTYNIKEFSKAVNTPETTIRRWIREGELKVHRTMGGKPFLTEKEFQQVVERNNVDEVYKLSEVAKIMHVDVRTVTRWVAKGELETTKTVGRKYVTKKQLEAFQEKRGVLK